MLSDRKIEANRQNAQHSTGPSTPEGRAAVRLNGLKHGLCAETIVVPGEDPAQFEALLEAYRAEYQPATPSAEFLVRQVAMADWRLLRLHRIEAAFHTIRHKELDRSRREELQCDNDARLAFSEWMDAGPKSVLANLHRYEIRLERSAKNARQELDRRPVALVSTVPVERPKAQPKAPPSPKIISMETVERQPAPTIATAEPLPSVPPADDLATPTEK
jgi:hypothetical protein